MNDEWLGWLLLTIAVGVGAVLYLALGRIPEIEDEAAGGPPGEVGAGAADGARHGGATASAAEPAGAAAAAQGATASPAVPAGAAAEELGAAAQSSPASTTVPGAEDPSDTRETP